MRNIKVKIKRSGSTDEYIVPVDQDDIVSVMNALEYIYENADSTLAFFHHAACKQAACGRCLVKVDGRVALACKTVIHNDEIMLEPWNDRVVRDLLCKNN